MQLLLFGAEITSKVSFRIVSHIDDFFNDIDVRRCSPSLIRNEQHLQRKMKEKRKKFQRMDFS